MKKTKESKRTIFLSFQCPNSEAERLFNLSHWLRSKGVKISRSKIILAAACQMKENSQTVEYLKSFMEANPDQRRTADKKS